MNFKWILNDGKYNLNIKIAQTSINTQYCLISISTNKRYGSICFPTSRTPFNNYILYMKSSNFPISNSNENCMHYLGYSQERKTWDYKDSIQIVTFQNPLQDSGLLGNRSLMTQHLIRERVSEWWDPHWSEESSTIGWEELIQSNSSDGGVEREK